MKAHNRRHFRNLLVYRDLQWRLIRQSIIYTFVIVIIAVTIALYPLLHDMVFSENLERQYEAAQIFLTLAQWLLPAVVLLLILFTAHLLLVTHRICGPLINFTHTFKRLAEGDLTRRVSIRHGDYLKSECERINLMIDGLSEIMTRLLADHTRLTETLQVMKKGTTDPDSLEKIEASLKLLRKDTEYLSNALSRTAEDKGTP
jgi:methyl-accepting chemotaxis protein